MLVIQASGLTPKMARVKEVTLIYTYGDTFDGYSVVWLDANEAPINLTGYTATLKVKNQPGTGATTLLTLTSGDGLTINALAGSITINAPPSKMLGGTLVQGTTYFYDLQVANSGGSDIKTLIRGKFWVDAQVTD